MYFAYQNDQIEIPRRLAEQEAVLQEIRGVLARPLVLNGVGRMVPITEQQLPTQVTRTEIVPFRKRDEPAKRTSPTPPHRPAPAQPFRPAAKHQEDEVLDAMKAALCKGVAITNKGDPFRRSGSENLGDMLKANLR